MGARLIWRSLQKREKNIQTHIDAEFRSRGATFPEVVVVPLDDIVAFLTREEDQPIVDLCVDHW